MGRFILLLCAVAVAFNVRPPTAAVAEVITTPVSVAGLLSCTLQCAESYCTEGEHDAWQSGFNNASWNGGPHSIGLNCTTGTCESNHSPLCPHESFAAGPDLEVLRVSLASDDMESARTVLSRHVDGVLVNVERSAIQLLNCSGEVVAHLPVPSELVARLSQISD